VSVLSSPGAWKLGLGGLQGVDWSALWPAVTGHPDAGRVPLLVRAAESAVIAAMAKPKTNDAARWAKARALDPKSADLSAYDLFDPATEVFA